MIDIRVLCGVTLPSCQVDFALPDITSAHSAKQPDELDDIVPPSTIAVVMVNSPPSQLVNDDSDIIAANANRTVKSKRKKLSAATTNIDHTTKTNESQHDCQTHKHLEIYFDLNRLASDP